MKWKRYCKECEQELILGTRYRNVCKACYNKNFYYTKTKPNIDKTREIQRNLPPEEVLKAVYKKMKRDEKQ